jgi:hypothetical protein
MKRNKGAIIGMMIAMAALILLITGCSSSNPVSPTATDNSDGKSFSPGAEAILSEPEIDGDLIDDDIVTGNNFAKPRPDITDRERDQPYNPDTQPDIPTDDADHLEGDIGR